MDKRLTTVTLGATDLRESDKTVRLFSLEEGLVTAALRGVRRQGAKLKFVAQPLAVCNVELSEKGGRLTVTGAECVEDSYSLCADPYVYAAACFVAECTFAAALSVEPQKMFVAVLKTLRALIAGKADPAAVAIKFTQKVLSMSGFIKLPPRREMAAGTPSALLDEIAWLTLDELEEKRYPRDLIARALKLLVTRFENVYERKLESASVLIKLNANFDDGAKFV